MLGSTQVYAMYCVFIMAVSVYHASETRCTIWAFKTDANEVETLKSAAVLFSVVLLCLLCDLRLGKAMFSK